MAGPGGSLDPLVRDEVEISLCRMVDPLVYHCPGQSVPVLVFVVVGREKPSQDRGDLIITNITGAYLV